MKMALFTENNELQSVKRFKEEALKLGIELDLINPFDTTIQVDDHSASPYQYILHRTSGIRFDDFEIALALHFQNRGSRIINPVQSLHFFRDKLMQHIQLTSGNVPMIPTMALRGRPSKQTISQAQALFKLLSCTLPYNDKFIVKMARGNHGVGVNIINGTDSLAGILETFWAIHDQRLLIQPYLDFASEYRIFFCNKKVISSLKRTKLPGEYRLNAGRGNAESFEVAQLPECVQDAVSKAIKTSGCHYGGIDILEKDGHAFLLELNQVPGFQQMEDLTELNIAATILKSLK